MTGRGLGGGLPLDVDPGTDSPGGAAWRAAAGRWIPRLYIGFAAALLPWDVYLAVSLPQRSISDHYRGTWVGFDLMLIVVLTRIGWLAHRRNPHVVLIAAAGAPLLMTDAWFDVTTVAPVQRIPRRFCPRCFWSSWQPHCAACSSGVG